MREDLALRRRLLRAARERSVAALDWQGIERERSRDRLWDDLSPADDALCLSLSGCCAEPHMAPRGASHGPLSLSAPPSEDECSCTTADDAASLSSSFSLSVRGMSLSLCSASSHSLRIDTDCDAHGELADDLSDLDFLCISSDEDEDEAC